MSFLLGLLVNGFLLAIPIGGTLGVMFALHPFDGEIPPLPPKKGPGIDTRTVCGDFHEYIQNKNGQGWTVNANQFPLLASEADSQICTTLTTFTNNTYTGTNTIPPFSVTWNYPFRRANESAPLNQTTAAVHAFPQAVVADGGDLPMRIENLLELDLDFSWTMGVGNESAEATSTRKLLAHNVNATVALDMFMDSDQKAAADPSLAAFEMIIFFAYFADDHPVGFGNGKGTLIQTLQLGDINFDLYAGVNADQKTVFSWRAQEPVFDFTGDVSPLFDAIIALSDSKRIAIPFPQFQDYIGAVGFGSQAYNADSEVTFQINKLAIDLKRV